MDVIKLKEFTDPQRAKVHDEVVDAVKKNPDEFINRYVEQKASFGGRYVSADLFKEMFEQYGASRESRNYYNNVVHNPAAVLSSEQFNRILKDKSEPTRDTVVFLTGIPGAGKTSSVLEKNASNDLVGLKPTFKMVFEGKLDDPKTSFPKIQQVLDEGYKPVLLAVHRQPEVALEHTFQRFNEEGRGASIETMASIQGKLPDGLSAIHKHFGNDVQLIVRDFRDKKNPQDLVGWENLNILKSEGRYEDIKHKLTECVEKAHKQGRISDDCYLQANGKAPRPIIKELAEQHQQTRQTDESRRSIPQGSGQRLIVKDEVKAKLVKQIKERLKESKKPPQRSQVNKKPGDVER